MSAHLVEVVSLSDRPRSVRHCAVMIGIFVLHIRDPAVVEMTMDIIGNNNLQINPVIPPPPPHPQLSKEWLS